MKVEQVEQLIKFAEVMAYKLPESEQNEIIKCELRKIIKEIRNPVIKGERYEAN